MEVRKAVPSPATAFRTGRRSHWGFDGTAARKGPMWSHPIGPHQMTF